MSQRVDLRFNDRPVRVPRGVTLFDAASWNGIAIDSTCGGHGTCKKCRVRFKADPPLPTSLDLRAYTAQEIKDGWRLACRTLADSDADVEVPPLTTRPKAATVGVGRQVILRPAVRKRYLELAEPSLADQVTDLERVLGALTDLNPVADLAVLRTLGSTLRQADFKVTAVVADETLIAVEPGDTTDRAFGLAFDLGTTTVVATLLDLTTGTPVAVESMLNKQQPFGADVIARISATMLDPAARDKLRQLAQETLAELGTAACKAGDVRQEEVYEVALAGNATMVHLVLGIDPEPLGVAPFIMSARLLPEVRARDLGVPAHPQARAVVFPAFGAYVGGDITAGLLASGMDRDPRIRLFIDIGTNCEIVLGGRDWLLATAAPAGPAFEGASIRCGMRAADGAIEAVAVTEDGDLKLTVIGDTNPAGLCGSGLVDAVAALTEIGIVDASGRFVQESSAGERLPGTEEVTGSPLADRLTMIGQGTRLRPALVPGPRPGHQRLPLPARHPRASVRQGRDRHRLAHPAGRSRPGDSGHQAGTPRGQLRLLPQRQVRHPHRPGSRRRPPPHHRRGQRGRRGREDGPPLHARPRRRPGPTRGGEICRTQRPPGLQRPLHRPTRLLAQRPSRR